MELSEKNAAQYLESRGILAHRVTELGGGISNVVLLVETGEQSFILKQSLSQLRVKDQWLADRSRIFREMESLIDAASILPEGSVPEVLWADKANHLFAMTAVSGLCWKNELMAGRIDSAIAARAGRLLGRLMSETWAVGCSTNEIRRSDCVRAVTDRSLLPDHRRAPSRRSSPGVVRD